MTRTMQTARPVFKSSKSTSLNKREEIILMKIHRGFSRQDIVEDLIKYIRRLGGGIGTGYTSFTRHSAESSGLECVRYGKCTRPGYRGHFAMATIRDQFPKGFFILETTELGPRLICRKYASEYLLENSRSIRNLWSVQEYREQCLMDPFVCDVCKICS